MTTMMRSNLFSNTDLRRVKNNPHIIGWMGGKDKLTTLHSRWIRYMFGSSNHRALQAHRGSYKTTSLAVGIVWSLLFNRNLRIGVFRKNYTDATKIVTMVKSMIMHRSIGLLFYSLYGIWPKFNIKAKDTLVLNLKQTNTPEGNIEARGWDFNITGAHYDSIQADDFVTLKDRNSRAEREHTKEVLRELRANVIDPSKPCSFWGTPWHKEDAWTLCPTPVYFDVYSTGILSDEEIEYKKKVTTPGRFAANYELKHISEEDRLFGNPVYGDWDFSLRNVYAHLDAAFDGDHYNALTFMARRKDQRLQAIGKVYAGNVKEWIDEIASFLRRFNANAIYIEENADKGYTADKLEELGIIEVRRYSEGQNKENKIKTILYEFYEQILWDYRYTDSEYMSITVDYVPGQEPDDPPDSASSLLYNHYYSKGRKNKDALYKL